ncbi:MAG: hypothetical protein LUC83_05765 [Clostridiales bacterium]|nr:hypothetical protein [Clostridiales bacterium]
MKKNAFLSLLAALATGSVLLFSGCSVDLTSINEEDTTLSAEMETANLSDGTLQVHSVWYESSGDLLASATVTFSDENGEICSAATDESGRLDACTLPGNTVITCEVADSSGAVIASSEMVFKISDEYSSLTIYTLTEENSQCVLEIPADEPDIRAAIFLTEDGLLSFANLTPWSDSYDEETTDTTDEDAEGEDASSDEAAEGEDASSDETSENGDTSSDETSEGGDTSSDETNDGEDTAE